MTILDNIFFYTKYGDCMKKFMPYILSLVLGIVFGILIFKNGEDTILSVFNSELKVTAFQLGVFNDIELAKTYQKKYPSSIIMIDDDVYRVYYSVLTDENVITKMENYLNDKKISFYKKYIKITDTSLIEALKSYEKNMIDASDITFSSINSLIMESYGGKI